MTPRVVYGLWLVVVLSAAMIVRYVELLGAALR